MVVTSKSTCRLFPTPTSRILGIGDAHGERHRELVSMDETGSRMMWMRDVVSPFAKHTGVWIT